MPGKQKIRTPEKKNKIDYVFLIAVMSLLCYGLIMVFSASSANAHYRYNDAYYFIKRQAIWAVVGVAIMFVASRIPYDFLYKNALKILAVSVVLLIAVPFVGVSANGAKRWLGFGAVTFQPSEVAKFAIIVFLARSLSVNKDALRDFTKGFLPYVAIIGIVAFLVVIEPHLSGAIVIALTGFIVLWAAGAKVSHFVAVGLPALCAAVALMLSADYRLERVTTFLDPFKNTSDDGWQVVQSLYAIGSGGFFGLGLGQSRQKFLYLPEPQNDFIFSVICEELGFIGAALVIALFTLLIWRGVRIAINAPNKFASLLVIGIMGLIAIQVIINIAVVTSSVPATGMPLPFFSYGGSSLVFILGEMGVVLSISRET
ncbi:MAG: putative lipid II flippase FtsW [Clostridia bacterium]|nr:putative lipid II flippase FtsW [Clostridia bacterium]